MNELKPCPFCGPIPDDEGIVDATRILGIWNFIHRCSVLGPVKLESGTREGVLTAWNTRLGEAAIEEEAFKAGVMSICGDDTIADEEWEAVKG